MTLLGLAPFGVTGCFGKLSEKFVRRVGRKGMRARAVCEQTAPPRVSPRKESVDLPFAEAFGTVHLETPSAGAAAARRARLRAPNSASFWCAARVSKSLEKLSSAASRLSRSRVGVAFGLRCLACVRGVVRRASSACLFPGSPEGGPRKTFQREGNSACAVGRARTLPRKILRPCLLGKRAAGHLNCL